MPPFGGVNPPLQCRPAGTAPWSAAAKLPPFHGLDLKLRDGGGRCYCWMSLLAPATAFQSGSCCDRTPSRRFAQALTMTRVTLSFGDYRQ
jgi:hypothetical protein